MRRVTRNGVIVAAAAASGAMALTMPVQADSSADGTTAGSPGAVSGNTVQLPVHVPVNVCGNTVNVVGLLNPAAGNSCANPGGGGKGHGGGAGAEADGVAKDSPGVVTGNGIQLPVDLPVNVSGNSVNVVGIGNPVFGNESVNGPGEKPEGPEKPGPGPGPETPRTPPKPVEPELPAKPAPSRPAEPKAPPVTEEVGSLAHTGADHTAPALAGASVLLVGGALLYRRFRGAAAE